MSKDNKPKVSFIEYIRASYPILWVQTHEEKRAFASMVFALHDYNETVGKKSGKKTAYVYDIVSGLRKVYVEDGILQINQKPIELTKPGEKQKGPDPSMPIKWLDPYMIYDDANKPPRDDDPGFVEKMRAGSVVFLKGYSPFLGKECKDATLLKRMILNSLDNYKLHGKTLVIISPELVIPMDMEKEITVVDFKLPTRDELKVVLRGISESAPAPYPDNDDQIVDAALGMTTMEAEAAFSVSLVKSKKFDPEVIRSEKAMIIKKTNLLEVVESAATMDDIGGLDRLKKWLMERRHCFSAEARAFGVEPPKGMLLVGIPGCGKSLTAKAVSTAWDRPLLRLDMGKVFGKYVGESENNLLAILDLAEAVAPCVLWIR